MIKIGDSKEKPDLSPDLSILARDFIEQCLEIIPHERKNVTQLLNHPFILKYNTDDYVKIFNSKSIDIQKNSFQNKDNSELISYSKYSILKYSKRDLFNKNSQLYQLSMLPDNDSNIRKEFEQIISGLIQASFNKSSLLTDKFQFNDI